MYLIHEITHQHSVNSAAMEKTKVSLNTMKGLDKVLVMVGMETLMETLIIIWKCEARPWFSSVLSSCAVVRDLPCSASCQGDFCFVLNECSLLLLCTSAA